MKKIRCVLFDLGNVLVHIHPAAFTRTLGIPDEEAENAYRVKIVSLVKLYENGEIGTPEYLKKLDVTFGSRYSIEILERAMLAVIGRPIAGMEEIVRQVSANVPVALVSNTNELHFEYSLESVPAVRMMSGYFLSYKLQAMKPDALYYAQVLRTLRIHPEEIVFIDDLPANVKGAQTAQMNGVLFTGAEDLAARLREFGVL